MLWLVETHQKFTVVGVVFLVFTFLINYYHQENHPGMGFNYAYVTGVIMLVAFSISFVMFTKNQIK